MAAANASPVHRSRTNGQAQQRTQTGSVANTSSGQHHVGGHHSQHQIQPGANSGTTRYDQMHSPNRTNHPGQQNSQNNHHISQRHLRELLNSSPADESFEIRHLRTQLGGVGVLQELLTDQRLEIQELQDVLESVVKVVDRNGIDLDQVVHEKLDRVRVGSVTLPDNQWSVELKRPPTCSMSPSMLTQVDGKDQIPRLKEQLNAKDIKVQALETKIIELRDQLQSSSDEKSQEIARLQAQLQVTSEDGQTSKDLCQSLTGEAELLRHKLQNMIQQCNNLASELTDFKRNKIPGGQVASTPGMMDTPVSAEDQLKIVRRQLEQEEREKEQISSQLKEVIRMNKRWQKYNQQQDTTKGELTQIRVELENRNKVLDLQCQDYEETMKKLQRQLQENEDRERHRRVDKTEASHKEDVIRRLQKEVIDLEQVVRKARRDSIKYDKEVVMQQLKQYTEDFQKEHTEKEKLKRENAILNRNHLEAEELVRQLSRQLEMAKRENQKLQREKRLNAGYKNVYPELDIHRERRELTPHGCSGHPSVVSLEGFPTLPKDVQYDGTTTGPNSAPPSSITSFPLTSPPVISPPVSPPTIPTPSPLGRDSLDTGKGQTLGDDEPLQCPRCLREFPVIKHSDFMRHTEQCLDQ